MEFKDKAPAVVSPAKKTISITIHGKNQADVSVVKGRSLFFLNTAFLLPEQGGFGGVSCGENRQPAV